MMAHDPGATPRLLILVGLVFQILEVVVVFGIALVLLFVPLLGGLLFLVGALGLVWLVLVYVYAYGRTRDGDFEGARAPTLVFAILSLITLHIVSGILYQIAYFELEKREPPAQLSWGRWSPPPPTPPVGSALRCPGCGETLSSGTRFCPACGRQLL
jgi:hypothetical protein